MKPSLPRLTEKQFQAQIVQLARLCGWRAYHTFDSRRSVAGFPDLLLIHPKRGEVIFAELKTDTGRLTVEQRAWIDDLRAAGAWVFIWRPRDWAEIEAILKGET